MFSKTSFFEASVRVNDSPTTEVSYNGRTYIEGRKNSEYELFFRNNSSKKIMVIPSVDGLSVLNGKLAGAGSPGFVVDPWGHLTVPGWKVDNKTAAKFEFRPVGDKSNSTYVETLKSDGVDVDSANQGLILFLIFEEKEQFDWNAVKNKINYKAPVEVKHWSPNPNSTGYVPPQSFGICHAMGNSINLATDDNLTINTNGPLFLNASATPFNSSYSSNNARLIPTASATSAQVGTGFGEATDFKTKKVEFIKKNPNTPDDILIIEYDTMQGLKARGVPVEMFRSNQTNTQRSAFPASPELGNIGCKPPKGWKR